jgi:RNA polymerase sigma-70 factor (ECF subfamily)
MDRVVVVRACGGDHDAFAEVAAATIGRLTTVARLILRDDEQAADAVQEALVDAWRGIRGLRDPDRLDAWLHRLVVRACGRQVRGRRRRSRHEIRLDPDAGFPVPAHEPAFERFDRIDRALRRLSADQRAVLVLTYFLDLPLADSAAILGVPLGTAKSRLSRSHDALRAAIEADERDGAGSVRVRA